MDKQTLLPIVLIADDDADDLLLITEAFSERCSECRIRFAQDGVQLMHMLDSEEPDLILLDLNMPLMDGRKALQKIKGSPRLRKIPTIVMTTSDDEEDIRFCYDAGVNSYIVKPPSYSDLLDIVTILKSYWMSTVVLPKRHE